MLLPDIEDSTFQELHKPVEVQQPCCLSVVPASKRYKGPPVLNLRLFPILFPMLW